MEHRLYSLAKYPLKLTWHENKTTYLTVRKEKSVLHLRLHRLFFHAPTPILEALLLYAAKRDREAGGKIKQMAHLYFSSLVLEPSLMNSQGKVYNLQEILDRMQVFMPIKVENISIGWSKRSRVGSFRSITYGTFNRCTREICIHPILDQSEVPLYFLEFIVYHELLHAIYPSKMDGKGKCQIHSKEFKEQEELFPRFKLAKEWEKKSLEFFKRGQKHGRS